jgi:hypothetical protein
MRGHWGVIVQPLNSGGPTGVPSANADDVSGFGRRGGGYDDNF